MTEMDTLDLSRATWRKSRHSESAYNCVEVTAADKTVAIRDSKAPNDPVIAITSHEWRAFTHDLKTGKFDL